MQPARNKLQVFFTRLQSERKFGYVTEMHHCLSAEVNLSGIYCQDRDGGLGAQQEHVQENTVLAVFNESAAERTGSFATPVYMESNRRVVAVFLLTDTRPNIQPPSCCDI